MTAGKKDSMKDDMSKEQMNGQLIQDNERKYHNVG